MKILRSCQFANGEVFALETEDGFPIETTDTFLPSYTKNAIGRKQNALDNHDFGTRADRWMVGVSVMSGCPVGCLFCATGRLKKTRMLTAEEIVAQVDFVVERNKLDPTKSFEFKVNYTRMGEPFLNIKAVREAIRLIDAKYPGTHHYVSTMGIEGSDFSWIRDNITLQLSVHSLDDERRNHLIPFQRKMTLEEMGQVRTQSHLKTTINLTLVDFADFDIERLQALFDPACFFVKISPINENDVSRENELGPGIIEARNLA